MTLFGLSTSSLNNKALHDLLGLGARDFSCLRNNGPWTSLPSADEMTAQQAGVTVYRNTMNQVDVGGTKYVPKGTNYGGVGSAFLPWGAIGDASDIHTPTGGSKELDAYYRSLKQGIADYWAIHNKPYLLAWCHEERTNNASQIAVGAMQANGTGGNGTAAEYAAAFRHISALMNDSTGPGHLRDDGKLMMCHVPTMPQVMCEPTVPISADNKLDNIKDIASPYGSKLSLVEPGSAYYDLFGVDFYPSPAATPVGFKPRDIQNFWDCVHFWAMQQGKPFVIGEFGIAGGGSFADKQHFATVIQQTAAALKGYGSSGPGSCLAWCTYVPAITDDVTPLVDDGSGRIQVVQSHIMGDPFFVFVGDVPPPPPDPCADVEAQLAQAQADLAVAESNLAGAETALASCQADRDAAMQALTAYQAKVATALVDVDAALAPLR